jgi:hypothetical protein
MRLEKRINKRGQVMELINVFTIVGMCALVVFLFLMSYDKVNASVVSPVPVLKLDDLRWLFENEEFDLLEDVYCSLEASLAEDVKEKFCSKLASVKNYDFLSKSTFPLDVKSGITSSNLCEKIYEFEKNGEDLKVVRSGIGKREKLEAKGEVLEKVRFDVVLKYELEKEYLLSREDCI